MSQSKYRLFFAVELSYESKKQLLEIQQRIPNVVGSPVDGQNLHITLSFIGNVSEKNLQQIIEGIRPISVQPFTVSLHDLIYWPKPKVLAISLNDPELKLVQCKKQIEKYLTEIDFFQFDKREYTPHITLFRQVESAPKENCFFTHEIQVKQISLMSSKQTQSGFQYDLVEFIPMQAPSVKQQLLG
ncbi:RNA 2',3'-cyclic phosphodiesterase [Aliikangiella sp. IMCC44359]|uniref:RNA 2',3'-cyclic phosphodiesterase n=1 Tax=Aliikangiella sp. IMCC44359 TaxID=3459125 RepID=UPI00403AADB7